MPNWCTNYVTVTGSVEALDKWRTDLINDVDMEPRLLFNKLLPLPEDQKDNWYDWHIENWGTKWDIGEYGQGVQPQDANSTQYLYDFDTAWSPPIEFFTTIAPRFPGVRFELGWFEEQRYFGGLLIIEDGQVVKNEHYQYDVFYEWAEDYFELDFSDYEEEEE